MRIYEELFMCHFVEHSDEIVLPLNDPDAMKSVCIKACTLLERISAIIRDDYADDESCFTRIEKIVCEFEDMGIDCANRHDFG